MENWGLDPNSAYISCHSLSRVVFDLSFIDSLQSHKGGLAITQLINKEKSKNNPDFTQLVVRLSKIEPLFQAFDDIQTQIECLEDTNDTVNQNERLEFEDGYYSVVSIGQAILNNCDDQNVDNASISNNSNISNAATQQVKLPSISLPSFDGKFDQFLFFKDTFQSLIHNNKSIPDINKFHYLRLSLKGQAADLLKSLEVSANNYIVAWNLLVQRYENKPLLKKNHIKALFETKPATNECHLELRNILDDMNRHLRALQVLEEPVDSWDALLIHLFSTKLDSITRCEWECEYAKHDTVTREIFCNFLSEKCRILETLNIQGNKVKQNVRGLFSSNSPNCYFCNKDHTIYNCKSFIALSPNSRLAEVKKLKLCINCLRNNHSTNQCRSMHCRKCNNKHNTLLHFVFNNQYNHQNSKSNNYNSSSRNASQDHPNFNPNANNSAEFSDSPEISANCLIAGNDSPSIVLLSTALVDIFDNRGNVLSCRILLDSGSESSFISEEMCKKLNIKTTPIQCSITGVGQKTTNILKQTVVSVQARQVSFKISFKCLVIPKITSRIPSNFINTSSLNIPHNLILADPRFNEPGPVDILIGADHFWDLLMVGQVKLGKHLPTLKKTQFGWIVSGTIHSPQFIQPPNISISCNLSTSDQAIHSQIAKFWEIEEINVPKSSSSDDILCEELFKTTTIRNSLGQFIVQIPFQKPACSLGDSKEVATKYLFNLEKRLQRNPELKANYTDFLSEYETLGHMTKINDSELSDKPCCYLPHHGVVKESSTTTKLRVVFNGSAVTTNSLSLNDILVAGPTIQDDLFSIVLRARKHNIMLTGDITKMYRQVLVDSSQRSLQLILWRPNPDSEIHTYQLNTLTYGTAPAAFLSTRCLKELSIQCKDTHPDISRIIARDFYVDDLCTGCLSIDEAIYIKQNLSEILISGGFLLRKFMCNAPEVICEQSEGDNTILNFGGYCNNKTLGLLWNSQSDTLQFSIKATYNSGPTKRKILGFSDSKEMAYGACIYIRSLDSEGTYHCHLLCSKTRVAPLKTITIPRLELCAALLLAELAHKVIISYVNTQENPADLLSRGLSPTSLIDNSLWWNGSKWLLYPKEQWPTSASSTLVNSDAPERRKEKLISFQSTVTEGLDLINRFSNLNKLQRISAYCYLFFDNCRLSKANRKSGALDAQELNHALYTLIRTVQRQEFPTEYQDLSKSKPINSRSKILRLAPFLDGKDIIRVGGRLKHSKFDFHKKYPAIIPGKHVLSKLIVKQEHLRLLHAGPQLLLASIRERFWPTSGRNLIKQVVRQCLRCFLYFGVYFCVSLNESYAFGTYFSLEEVYSDHGTNFVGAKNEIHKFLHTSENEIQSILNSDNVKRHFIPPHTPHFGGIWEAGVKSTKFHLKRILGQIPLSYEDFVTVLHQVEACLNSQPLSQISNDPNDPQSLTPAHFLIGERITALPDHDYSAIKENSLSKSQRLQRIIQNFWKRWSKEYISELQQRSKWKKTYPTILRPGLLVLVKEDGIPPMRWKIGVIEVTHPGADGIVRAVTIRTGSSVYKRPAMKICVLPEDLPNHQWLLKPTSYQGGRYV
ncbi:uncharacterized protein [Diabrotica undecimpunctata]|uniref:uncharacterized protein n=1 Tax=Diabrotica undecimpunctata TaxID=50387 RepID=UPI003B64260E